MGERRDGRAARARVLVLVLSTVLLACVGWLIARQLQHARSNAIASIVFLLVPLLLPLRGVWRSDRRTYAWATLCLTPVFVYALTEIVANPSVRALAVVMLLAAFALLVALVSYLRLTRAEADRR